MKKIIALLLVTVMLLAACGAADETTAPKTDAPEVTDAPETDAPETDAPETDAPETEPAATEPPAQKEDYTVSVKGDTYVLNKDGNGDQSAANFGAEGIMHVKTYPGSSFTRYGYLKFDISEIINDSGVTAIELSLKLKARQNSSFGGLEIYGTNPDGWSETTITFANQPETYSLITANYELDKNGATYTFPVTDYVKKAIANGQNEIAFYLKEASTSEPLQLQFYTKESGESAPMLSVYHGTKTDGGVYNGLTCGAVSAPEQEGRNIQTVK